MGKVNQLFQDEQERKAVEWLKANPGKTEEDAYRALYPDIDEEPLVSGGFNYWENMP